MHLGIQFNARKVLDKDHKRVVVATVSIDNKCRLGVWNFKFYCGNRHIKFLPTCSSTQYQSDFKCTGKLNNEDARKKVLDSHNNYRRKVAAGNVTNKRGYIPEAGDMIELIYACDLEEKAQDLIDGCPTKDKFSYSGAYNFLGATVGTTPEDATTKWYNEYTDGNVRWPRKNILIKTQVNNAQFVSFANVSIPHIRKRLVGITIPLLDDKRQHVGRWMCLPKLHVPNQPKRSDHFMPL
ncbi:unnamed protein product [Nippostrongylus brasiliensis]|uniref:SCP domain-containing protein n=1 Tax=Nippostrongylus brasiliensis TaxID=27835 RepID=A0A0N4XMP5_NIPBR|nr:unnamed protein product [Nippostrongylus brasiliensis]